MSKYDCPLESERFLRCGVCQECQRVLAEWPNLEAERDRLRTALSWSFIRTLLSQGMSIQQDYDAGKYAHYEEVAARLDAAAGERIAALEGEGDE